MLLLKRRLKDKQPQPLTPNMAMPFRPFSNVPDEVLLIILGNASATDHLNIKLVCKKFCRCASAINTTTLSLAEAAKCHADIEASFPRNRALMCCCCTRCGLVKDTDQFSDPQAKKTTKNRTCIACGIRRLKYSAICFPSVGGEERIPCYDCRQPMPTYDGWELKMAEAKLLLPVGGRKIYCEHCLESRLCRKYPTVQQRNQEIARIHADPACAWYWQRAGV